MSHFLVSRWPAHFLARQLVGVAIWVAVGVAAAPAASAANPVTIKGFDGDGIDLVSFTPDGKKLLLVGYKNTYIHDMVTRKLSKVAIEGADKLRPTARLLSPDGAVLAAAQRDSLTTKVQAWDVNSGKSKLEFSLGPGGDLLAISGDGKRIAVGEMDQTAVAWKIRFWDLDSGEEDAGASLTIERFVSPVTAVYGASNKTLTILSHRRMFAGGRPTDKSEGIIAVWDLEKGAVRNSFAAYAPDKLLTRSYDLALSPDDTTIATSANDNQIQLWRSETGKCQAVLSGVKGGKNSYGGAVSEREVSHDVTFSPDGKLLAALSLTAYVSVFDVATGTKKAEFHNGLRQGRDGYQFGGSRGIAISPDNKFVAAGGATFVNMFALKSTRTAATKKEK